MGAHSLAADQVDTRALTDDFPTPFDDLVHALYPLLPVTLAEARAVAARLTEVYELAHKVSDVAIDRQDIDPDAFAAILDTAVFIRHHGDH